MGGVNPSKMPGKKTIKRKDNPDAVTVYAKGGKATGERYLPKKAREVLTSAEYAATTKAKRAGTKAGKQFVKQPKRITKKTATVNRSGE
jgi:hypothetical protein